ARRGLAPAQGGARGPHRDRSRHRAAPLHAALRPAHPRLTTGRTVLRPHSVLFACTLNAVRSPIAETYLKHLLGKQIYVDSAGLKPSELDGFAIAVMDELGFDLKKHKPKTFDQLEDTSFDLIITLSPEAHHKALEWARHMATDVEYWPTFDPTAAE